MVVKMDMDQFDTLRTTVSLPAALVERTQVFIERGLIPNRSAAIAAALESYLDELERQEIDRAFEAMATDESYRRMSEELDREFAASDWQAIQKAESGV